MPAASGERQDGFLPLREYGVIGDGRTAALVGRDGAIDWLCLPDFDSPSVFGAILDPDRGGSFQLQPCEPFSCERRYRDGTNVLETRFTTPAGSVRVTDAMTLADVTRLSPMRELVRRVEGLAGKVMLRWAVAPRFAYGDREPRWVKREHHLVAADGPNALALASDRAGDLRADGGVVRGTFALEAGERAMIMLVASKSEPLVFSDSGEAEERLEQTAAFWRRWAAHAQYDGPWRDAVVRSALALKLLVFAPSGAIVAAPTTSLPEAIGGARNWDYRFTWVRDATYTLDALLSLGYHDEAHAFFWWLMHASRLTRPRLEVLYGIYGSRSTEEIELERLRGYRDSRPVRVGNGAARQTQLDVYGTVMNAVWLHAQAHDELQAETGRAIAKLADFVADVWRSRDSGIWEVRSTPAHFIQSKAMCWVALDRAAKLAESGFLPDRVERWRAEADAIRRFIEDHGWDERRGSYIRAAGGDEVDASLLTLFLVGYDDTGSPRLQGTLEAIRRELGNGALLMRYGGEDGLRGGEGAFLTCSFWLADALARSRRTDEAATLMDELVGLANDLGLFAEEVDRDSGAFLGNFPQALVHLALINAAVSIARG